MKYFNFLLENEINFNKDETGSYIALVKVLNPQYYAEKEKHRNIANFSQHFEDNEIKEEKSITKGRSSSMQMKNNKKSGKKFNKNPEFEKTEIKRALPNYCEIFAKNYPKFFNHLNPLLGVRGKRVHISQLKYVIEEIYSIRFIKDTSSLKNQIGKKAEIEGSEPFSVFVVDFFINKFIKKQIVDQHALDLLMSIEYYKDINREVGIFTKFLTGEYDTDDLIFFLFVRSCIEKEMKIMFIEKARDDMKQHTSEDKETYNSELYLNIKVCLKIANTIFGNEEELLLNSFREKVEKNMEMMEHGRYVIKASTVLDITLEDYHESRQQFGNEFGGSENQNNNNSNSNNMYNNLNLNPGDVLQKKQMNFRGSKVFDEYNEDETPNDNRSGMENQRVSISKYIDKDPNANEDSNNRKYSNNKMDDESFIDSNAKNNNQQRNYSNINNSFNDKISLIKVLISNYLKEKELDIFFDKLMTSYTTYEKNNENIQKIMANIKDLVSKKLNILINLLFNKDKNGWINSLKIQEDDMQSLKHYEELIYMINKMIELENVKEIQSNKIEEFSQTLLITPELISQINKLILKQFG